MIQEGWPPIFTPSSGYLVSIIASTALFMTVVHVPDKVLASTQAIGIYPGDLHSLYDFGSLSISVLSSAPPEGASPLQIPSGFTFDAALPPD